MLEMHSVHSDFSRNSRLQILSKTLYCVAMKQQIRGQKSKPQKGKPIILVCGFETGLHVLIFIVNGHFTISIPEISQVFTVFCV